MPGFAIHIAIGKTYLKKHKNEIKDEDEFFKGILAPDLISLINKDISKSETHYGKWGNKEFDIYLGEFFKDKNVDMYSDYWKRYFIHLLNLSFIRMDHQTFQLYYKV